MSHFPFPNDIAFSTSGVATTPAPNAIAYYNPSGQACFSSILRTNANGEQLAIGVTSPTCTLDLAPTAISGASGLETGWRRLRAQTYTDNVTAGSGTATQFAFDIIERPTLAASNSAVTTTDAASVYIAGTPIAGTNMTITNPWSLWIDSGNVRFDGALSFYGSTSGSCKLQAAAAAGTVVLTLPTTDGDANQYLQTDGSGVLSWATPAPAGNTTEIQYNLSGAFSSNADFTIDGNRLVTIGGTSGYGSERLKVQNVGTVNDLVMSCSGANFTNRIITRVSRNTLGSPNVSVAGDDVLYLYAQGYGGTAYKNAAVIGFNIDSGTISDSSMPGYITFWTTPDGSVTYAERMRLTSTGNLVIKGTAAGASAVGCLVLSNSATAPSASANLVHLYSVDISADNAALGIYAETAAISAAAVASTDKIPIKYNGTTYYLLATTVA